MHEIRNLVPGKVWVLSTSFRMYGIIPLDNNALIFKATKQDGSSTLVAANAPELSPRVISDLRGIETEVGAKFEYVIGSDWHHLHVKQWSEVFSGINVLFPGTRGWRFYENEDFKKTVLNREAPSVPDVKEDSVKLIPWLGFDGPNAKKPEDVRRGEVSVLLPEHRILFIFDIFVPLLPWKRLMGFKATPDPDLVPMANFGKTRGFWPKDRALCSASAQQLLSLDLETVVFSHGDLDAGGIKSGKDKVQAVFNQLRSLIK